MEEVHINKKRKMEETSSSGQQENETRLLDIFRSKEVSQNIFEKLSVKSIAYLKILSREYKNNPSIHGFLEETVRGFNCEASVVDILRSDVCRNIADQLPDVSFLYLASSSRACFCIPSISRRIDVIRSSGKFSNLFDDDDDDDDDDACRGEETKWIESSNSTGLSYIFSHEHEEVCGIILDKLPISSIAHLFELCKSINRNPIIRRFLRCKSSRKYSNTMDDESMQQILSNLPVKTLMKFKCVSKSWKSLTHDPSFIKLYQSKSHLQLLIMTYSSNSISVYTPSEEFKGGKPILKVKIPWSQVSIFKPINGLFCFVDLLYNMSRFYNVATRQSSPWISTPVPTVTGLFSTKLAAYGFGFDRLTGRYKLVCIWDLSKGGAGYGNMNGKVDHVCQVLTMGEDEWRTIMEVPPMRPVGANVYANGSIYMRNRDDIFLKSPDREVLIAFDLGTEKFRIVPIPEFVIDSYKTAEETPFRRARYLLEVDEHIAIIDRLSDHVAKLWISDDDCMNQRDVKWVEETIAGLPLKWSRNRCILFQGVKGKKEIIFRATTAKDSVNVYLFDRIKKSFREIVIFDMSPTKYQKKKKDMSPTNNSFNYAMFTTCDTLLSVEIED